MSLFTRKFPRRSRISALLLCLLLTLPNVVGRAVSNTLAIPTVTPTGSRIPITAATQTITPTLAPAATEAAPLCGGPRVMFILLIGSDARRNAYNVGLADAIRLVRVDFVEPGVQLLTFPRDLYTEIPGIENHGGITHGKLNQRGFGNLF